MTEFILKELVSINIVNFFYPSLSEDNLGGPSSPNLETHTGRTTHNKFTAPHTHA